MADDGDSEGFRVLHNDNYETKPSPVPAMSNFNSQKAAVNRTAPTKGMYWFAQTVEPSEEDNQQVKNNSFTKKEDSYWFAHGGVNEMSVTVSPYDDPDAKESLLQKEREERVKQFKEQQEEERRKKQQGLEQSFMVAKKYREQQEAERRRKIEEARLREEERRQQVEERKRQIWEAEQERKEAILRRNMEREARIEARRNAHRNSMSFAFGSSTPRTFDLDLAALGAGRGPAQGSVLMSAVSGRRSEEREFGAKRATSACSLDRKFEVDSLCGDNSDYSRDCSRESSLEPSPSRVNIAKQIAIEHMNSDRTKACLTMLDDDSTSQSFGDLYFHSSTIPGWLRGSGALVEGEDLMSRSMVSLSSVSRGRRRTDLTPTAPRDRSTTPILISRGKQSLRAVSMTRLDQLAQPRRRFVEPPKDSTMISSPMKSKMSASSMSKSMCNLADSNINSHSSRLALHIPSPKGDSSMSRSMMHLPESGPHRGRTVSPRPSPTSPKPTSLFQPALRSAQSMTHLAVTPRSTRATRLRATAVANAKDGHTASMLNLCKPEIYANGRLTLSVMKDNSQSPSRPQSSMSRTSEISTTSSQASGVMLRPKPAPRRPRPVSIAGTTLGSASINASPPVSKRPERPTRPTEKAVPKPSRARSAEPDQRTEESSKPKSAPKKPVPPPKTSEILAKAKSRPVPSKDNLRKRVPSAEPAKKSTGDPQIKSSTSPELEVKAPSSPELEVKAPSSPELEVKAPSSPELEVKAPSSPELEVKVPSSPELEVNAPPSPEPEIKNLPFSEPEVKTAFPVEPEIKNSLSPESEIKSLPSPEPQVVVESIIPVLNSTENVSASAIPDLVNNQSSVVSSDQPVPQGRSEKDAEQSVEVTPSKPRITSEEEARAALAEKRRLAREQAEREAELERQRQEELRRQEEERQRLEELEQKRLEEEQIRLAELHRKLEEEKLRKAIEEQQQREKEEREKREEEARQKLEKEEQERKAREEAEKQRLELEERLRKEEEERAERKRRVEQIMSRTRARAGASSQQNSQNTSKATTPADDNKTLPGSDNPSMVNSADSVIPATQQSESVNTVIDHNNTAENKCTDVLSIFENNLSNKADSATSIQTEILQPNSINSTGNHVEQLLNLKQDPVIENGHYKENVEFPFGKTNLTNDMNHASNRTSECIDISLVAQTNGYSSHEEMSCTTSPEEKSETSDASGIGLAEVVSQPCIAMQSEQSEFDQLIDLGQVEQSSNSHLDNFLINSDDLNSNIISPGKPFIAFEDNISKKQETSVTDLLS